jgi:AraC-like DNA-binding protein
MAQKVGFTSKSSFNACLKKVTRQTPTQFKRDVKVFE